MLIGEPLSDAEVRGVDDLCAAVGAVHVLPGDLILLRVNVYAADRSLALFAVCAERSSQRRGATSDSWHAGGPYGRATVMLERIGLWRNEVVLRTWDDGDWVTPVLGNARVRKLFVPNVCYPIAVGYAVGWLVRIHGIEIVGKTPAVVTEDQAALLVARELALSEGADRIIRAASPFERARSAQPSSARK